MENELISVIVPVYKVEKYINKCIKSIVNQTYKQLEILLIDDGSTDNCPQICDEWAKKDTRIKVFHKKNGGLSDARNYGIKMSKGKYLCFVDSDDYIHKTMIETLYCELIKNDAKMACVGFEKVEENSDADTSKEKNQGTKVLTQLEAHKLSCSSEEFGNYVWNKIYLKELFNDIKFPTSRKMEDLAIMYLLINKCHKVVYNSKKLYYYVQRPGSILSSKNIGLIIDKTEFTIEKYNCLQQKYGFILENEVSTLSSLIDSYPYLENKSKMQIECENIINKISKNKIVKNQLTSKRKLKLFIYKISKKIYVKLFKKF